MKYVLLLCLVMIGGMACHKSGTSATSGISGSANYDSITLIGSNPFTNSQLQPTIAVTVGNQMLFGGCGVPDRISDTVFIFDAEKDQWSVTEMGTGHGFGGAIAVDSLIIFAGGKASAGIVGEDGVDIYTPSTGKWTTAVLSQARYSLAAASAGSIAAFGGGQTGPNGVVATVDLYDAMTGTWKTSALSVPRTTLAAAGAGAKILFAGGEDNLDQLSDLVDIYDINTGLWTTAHLSAPRSLIATAVIGHQLIFAGGYSGNGFSDAVDIYDVSTGQWSVSRLREPCRYNGGAASSGNLACFFSSYSMSGSSDTVDIYNASTGGWSSVGILPDNRTTLCGAAVGNQVITMGVQDGLPTTAYYYQLK